MEITPEEEAQIHALSDSELAAVFAFVEAAEYACEECIAGTQSVPLESGELFGSYTVVQQLRIRFRQHHTGQDSKSAK